MSPSSKYRSRAFVANVIAFSISYQRDNLLARGFGVDHLRELLIRLARPILRHGASLAYGGDWKERNGNFTFDLLRLVSAEQEDNSIGGPDSDLQIGKLYNHVAWPHYLEITPKIEAQWINSCRIVRVAQEHAGFAGAEIVSDEAFNANPKEPRAVFSAAVTLSAMRRLSMEGTVIAIPDVSQVERIPAVTARILLGGSVDNYSGFMPGIFEEALVTFERQCPVYILGGFGGAAEVLAEAILATGSERPEKLQRSWHGEHNPALALLLENSRVLGLAGRNRSTAALLDALFRFVLEARADLSGTLKTGLSEQETRELLTTRDIATAVRLVRTGLGNNKKLPALPA